MQSNIPEKLLCKKCHNVVPPHNSNRTLLSFWGITISDSDVCHYDPIPGQNGTLSCPGGREFAAKVPSERLRRFEKGMRNLENGHVE